MDDMSVPLCNQCGISFARFLHTAVTSLSAYVPLSVPWEKKKKGTSSLHGGFNGYDITPSSPAFDVSMGGVLPALVSNAALFELLVSSNHFTFCLTQRRLREPRIPGAVFKQRPQNLYFSNRPQLLLVMSVP